MVMLNSIATAVVLFTGLFVEAHPGDDHHEDFMKRNEWLNQVERRDLSHCAEKLKARGVDARSHARRRELASHLRLKRNLPDPAPLLKARDLATAANTSHLSSLTGLTADSTDETLFSGNSTCILNPEVTEGPYYVLGELIRKNITENQAGVPLTLDIQMINVETCEPITDIHLDLWHCNSTGVYSGIIANGNGNSADTSNINKTFLRGIQPSDDDGVVVFDTRFPGHYQGRATHIHILGHIGATIGSNGTLSSQGSVDHVGQIFFDQDLLSQVSAVEPYSSNTQAVTLNVDDMIAWQAAVDVDPFATFVLLGNAISDGILAWTTIGVNVSAQYNVSAAATLYADGGVANSNGMAGGPNGTTSGPPSGANGTMALSSGNATLVSSSSGTSASSTASSATTSVSSSNALSNRKRNGMLMAAIALFEVFLR